MFRKFLKRLPKEDGLSILDWETYYREQTWHLWNEEKKALLEDLVKPVPSLFRDVARSKIAAKIGEIALKEQKGMITHDVIIRGYILATPKRDHSFLRKTLLKKNIDVSSYKHIFTK